MKKSKLFLRILFAFVISCCFVGVAVAIPQQINYQAVIKNKTTGQILPDGNYTLTFRLYTVSTGGSALWAETATATITNGILTHQLGSVTALNLAFDQNYYLGVQVAGDSEMTPREQLVSLGYAFVAQNAEMLNGYNPGNSSGNIPLNNGTVNTDLNADKLDGQHGSFYQNAANLNTGTITADRLRNFYSYTSTTVAHYAFNADKLDNQHQSYYQNASNLNSGILPAGRLVGSYSSASVSFADSAAAAGLTNISYSPITISQPGSYIVVADLHTPQNVNCITIATSDVTLDLNGHTLYGAGTTAGSTGCGIYASYSNNNIAVKNGVVRDFRDSGIYLDGLNSQVMQIRAYANRMYGIYVNRDGTVTGNSVCYNNEYGIYAFLCCTVTGNCAYQNGTYGISASVSCTVTGNSAYQNGETGIVTSAGCVVTNNNAYENSGRGISTGSSNNVTGNSVYHNSQHGILTGECNTVIGNSSEQNGGDGIYAGNGSTVKDNTVRNNTGNGIQVSNATQVIGNTCSYNGLDTAIAAGIRINNTDNSIEHNLLIFNDYGLLFSGNWNFYASNRASGNSLSNYSTGSYQIDGGSYDSALSNISYYFQPNPVIQQIVGFELPILREAEATAPIHSIRW